MSNLIKKVFPGKPDQKEAGQPIKPEWKIKHDAEVKAREIERATRKAESLASRKATYQRLMELLQSGDAVELTRVWVHFMSGNGMEILVNSKSLLLLRDLIESEPTRSVKLDAWFAASGPRTKTVIRLRAETVCYVSEHSGTHWILAHGEVFGVAQADVVVFAQKEGIDQ